MEHTGTTATPDVPSIPLTDSVSIPQVGFGVFQISASTTQQAVEQALEIGYRHIDTAAAYYNEREVGDALKATGMTGKVFVTSKLRNCDQGYDAARVALDTTLNNLGLDHLDLYLIHWPFPAVDQYVETWKALLEIQQEGTIRAGGVSNFLPEHLQRLIDETGKTPAINQLEVHPSFSQTETLKFCKEHGIVVEAYSPLGHGSDMKAEPIQQAAEAHDVTPAQVVLRWHVQSGRIVIPKSTHAERMRQNLYVFSFELTDEEMQSISALHDPANRVGADPATFVQSQSWANQKSRGNIPD